MPEYRWWPIEGATGPADGVVVWTRVDSTHGIQNEVKLTRSGPYWLIPGGDGTPVAYAPTHWRPVEPWEL